MRSTKYISRYLDCLEYKKFYFTHLQFMEQNTVLWIDEKTKTVYLDNKNLFPGL